MRVRFTGTADDLRAYGIRSDNVIGYLLNNAVEIENAIGNCDNRVVDGSIANGYHLPAAHIKEEPEILKRELAIYEKALRQLLEANCTSLLDCPHCIASCALADAGREP